MPNKKRKTTQIITHRSGTLLAAESKAEQNKDQIKPGYAYVATKEYEWRALTLHEAMIMWHIARKASVDLSDVQSVGTVG